MYYDFGGSLGNLPLAKHRKSRAINAENPKGEKGKVEWLPAIWDLPEREALALEIF